MMCPIPGNFDDIITKVDVDVKRSDIVPKIVEMMLKKEKKDEDSEHTTEGKD